MPLRLQKRDVVRLVLEGKRPPYVPWSMGFTKEAREKLQQHYDCDDIEEPLQNHLLKLGSDIGFFDDLGDHRVRDVFGVVWDRTHRQGHRQLSTAACCPSRPWPATGFPILSIRVSSPTSRRKSTAFPTAFASSSSAFLSTSGPGRCAAWPTLMTDFHDHPQFVHELLGRIANYNIAQVREALKYDIDAVYFGDDWGQQHGLQMGPRLWRLFLRPVLQRMYARGPPGGQVRDDPLLRRRRRVVRRPGCYRR